MPTYILLRLQTLKGSYAYSTIASNPITSFLGKTLKVALRNTTLIPGQQNSKQIETIWLDYLDEQGYQELLASHPVAYLCIKPDGTRSVVTQAQYDASATPEPVTASTQPVAS